MAKHMQAGGSFELIHMKRWEGTIGLRTTTYVPANAGHCLIRFEAVRIQALRKKEGNSQIDSPNELLQKR